MFGAATLTNPSTLSAIFLASGIFTVSSTSFFFLFWGWRRLPIPLPFPPYFWQAEYLLFLQGHSLLTLLRWRLCRLRLFFLLFRLYISYSSFYCPNFNIFTSLV